MKTAELQVAGINLDLVAWLARHAKDAPALVGDLGEVVSDLTAKNFQGAWTAFKSAGDIVVADLADFPGIVQPPAPQPQPDPPAPIGPVTAVATVETVDAQLEAIGDGHLIAAVIALVTNPEFVALLTLLLKLFGVAL